MAGYSVAGELGFDYRLIITFLSMNSLVSVLKLRVLIGHMSLLIKIYFTFIVHLFNKFWRFIKHLLMRSLIVYQNHVQVNIVCRIPVF